MQFFFSFFFSLITNEVQFIYNKNYYNDFENIRYWKYIEHWSIEKYIIFCEKIFEKILTQYKNLQFFFFFFCRMTIFIENRNARDFSEGNSPRDDRISGRIFREENSFHEWWKFALSYSFVNSQLHHSINSHCLCMFVCVCLTTPAR